MLFKDLLKREQRLPVVLMTVTLVAATAFGGSNRGDVLALTLVRLAGVVALAGAIAWMPPGKLGAVRMPLALLSALAAWMTMQLVPLPPAIWTALPGRDRLAATAVALGTPQPWMPISMVPMRTLGSLLSLVVPAAMLTMVAWLPRRTWRFQSGLLILIGLASGLLALVQISGPENSIWYLYDVRQKGGAVGLFANRNHQAVFLVCLLPLLASFAIEWVQTARAADRRAADRGVVIGASCAAAALFLLPLIFITGSRAGLALTPVGVGGAAILVWMSLRGQRLSRRAVIASAGVILVVAVGLVAALLSNRSLSMERLAATDVTEERRVHIIDPILQLARENLPIGSGFGTFDTAFRAIEPYSQLYRTYLNHAHSDPLEFVSDGGVPAAIVLLLFLGWWMRATFVVWFRRNDMSARAASVGTALFMVGSLVDYPLRTPLVMAVFAMLVGWMSIAIDRASDADSMSNVAQRRRRERA